MLPVTSSTPFDTGVLYRSQSKIAQPFAAVGETNAGNVIENSPAGELAFAIIQMVPAGLLSSWVISPNPVEKFWLYTTTRSLLVVGVVAVACVERSNSVFEGAFGAALMSVNDVVCAVAVKAKPIAPQRVKSFFILSGLI